MEKELTTHYKAMTVSIDRVIIRRQASEGAVVFNVFHYEQPTEFSRYRPGVGALIPHDNHIVTLEKYFGQFSFKLEDIERKLALGFQEESSSVI